jgi:NitT/TauT family transport system ATP-binding protein
LDALTIENLEVTYGSARGDVTALSGLTTRVGDGEFVSVLGPSGCGKSTLLKVASGLLRPSRGAVSLFGTPVTAPRPDVGIVFQNATLVPWKSVEENVLLPIRTLGLDLAQGREKTRALLGLVGLGAFTRHYPHELSGGMQQRVAIARCLVHDPRLLLMDEPFAALDAMTREHMQLELQRIWIAARKSVLFITHSIPEAVLLSDRIVVLAARPGRLIEDIAVDLPRPRTIATLAEPRFAEITTHLRQLFSTLVSFDAEVAA